MKEVKEYARLSIEEIGCLNRAETVFLLAVSPLEAHGPHLCVGTDVFVAEVLQKRYIAALQAEYPHLTLVLLPSLYLGADALPYKGSLSVPASHLRGVLLAYAKGLAAQGFKYLFLSDNHGGPRHQLAIEAAARKAWQKYGLHLVNPFGHVFRLMVEHDAAFLQATGLAPGTSGDDADSHAGTNETSLALAIDSAMIRQDPAQVPPSLPPQPAKPLLLAARLAGLISPRAKGELIHLANTLAWVGSRNMLPYMGSPALATAEAGEAMLQARVEIAMSLFRRSLAGEQVKIYPLLWFLRILQHLPE